MPIQNVAEEEVLVSTGRIPLPVRLISLPFLAGLTWVIVAAFCELGGVTLPGMSNVRYGLPPVLALPLMILLDLFFVGLWVWQDWLCYEPASGLLVRKHRGFLGVGRTEIPVADVEAVQVRRARMRSTVFRDLSAVRRDGSVEFLVRVHGEDPEGAVRLAARIATAIGRPVHFEEAA